MQSRLDLKNRSGTILIVTLWILVILTVFAIALGQRASLEVKLAEYQRDKLRAQELAKAAIERAIWEKLNDSESTVDALSESWSSNEAVFKDTELGDASFTGTFTASYSLDETTLYGMEDEKSKININKVGNKSDDKFKEEVLIGLLENCGVESAGGIAHSIVVWSGGADDTAVEIYYDDLPYKCKKADLKSIPELLLVRYGHGEDEIITSEILYGKDEDGDGKISEDKNEEGIARYITVYGDGAVNINTASRKVLTALIGSSLYVLAEAIVAYRQGDGDLRTRDDNNWFLLRGNQLQLSNPDAPNAPNAERLQSLVAGNQLSVNSNIYTIHAQAEVSKVKSSLTATVDLSDSSQISYLFWQKN